MTIWTLRHPPVDRQGRCVGQTVIETTISGADAVALAMEAAPFRPGKLFSSDLPRCATLARDLAAAWSVPVRTDARLREMDFGEWEGRTYDAIDAEDGPRWRAWCADWQTITPPGGESLHAFASRVGGWLEDQAPSPTDAIVTHAGVIRVFRALGGATWEEAMASDNPFLGWIQHSIQHSIQDRFRRPSISS
ncbi:MAG: histidine phosphatase family protein [Candidatus Binatia bacterium]|nr:histidine phosphatase family protein [Candidatus Binatia bacterium]MDG1958912.1 histidine phosphatase family protein [Candidatus Binatia bacterium]MDG2008710.1 histidine phosphatase family protein [Candidatus Binatia bacterium]